MNDGHFDGNKMYNVLMKIFFSIYSHDEQHIVEHKRRKKRMRNQDSGIMMIGDHKDEHIFSAPTDRYIFYNIGHHFQINFFFLILNYSLIV